MKSLEYLVVWKYNPDDLQGELFATQQRSVHKATNVQRAIEKLWKELTDEYALDRRKFVVIAALPYDRDWMEM